VKERRTDSDGEAILAEALARLRGASALSAVAILGESRPGLVAVLGEDENALGGPYGLDPVQPVWELGSFFASNDDAMFAQLFR
jgi:hypothetical protein